MVSPNLMNKKNQVSTNSAWLILLELTLTNDEATKFYLVRNNEDVAFGVDDYDVSKCTSHWKLNDNDSSTVIIDSAGSYNGTFTQNTENSKDNGTDGSADGAMIFNGTTDNINFGDIPIFDDQSVFSLSMWIKPTSTGSDQILLEKSGVISLKITDSGSVVCSVNNNSVITTTTLPDNTITFDFWNHIVVVFDTALLIYANGDIQNVIGEITSGSSDTSSNDLIVGNSFDGSIDNIQVYHRTLVDKEVVMLYNHSEGSEKTSKIYSAFNFELDDQVQETEGKIPSFSIRVSNVSRIMQPYMKQLQGGVGSSVVLITMNSDLPCEDYSDTTAEFLVIGAYTDNQWVSFTLGASNPMRSSFPLYDMVGLHCGWNYNWPNEDCPECGYAGQDVDGITLTGTDPVSITMTSHIFSTGDYIKFIDVGGTTELNGNSYIITVVDNDNFTLDDTDSSEFTTWTSNGRGGFASCKKTLDDCRLHNNSTMFGGFPGMRSKSVRII